MGLSGILIWLLELHRSLTSRDLGVLGILASAGLALTAVYYRLIWMPSPTVFVSDHFVYLGQSYLLLDTIREAQLPTVQDFQMNSVGTSLMMAALFLAFEPSSLLVVVTQSTLLAWSVLCLVSLFVSAWPNMPKEQRFLACQTLAIFLLLPASIGIAGCFTKDSLALVGVALSLAGGYGIFSRPTWKNALLLATGISITLLARPTFAGGILGIFALFVAFQTFTLRKMLVGAVALACAGLIVYKIADTGILGLEGSSTGELLSHTSDRLKRGKLESEKGSQLRSVGRLLGDSLPARIVTIPLTGFCSWFVPFPFWFRDDLLHKTSPLINIPSLTLFLACCPIIWRITLRTLRRRANSVCVLMIIAALVFFSACALSQIPQPRYRFTFDWVIIFFFALDGYRRLKPAFAICLAMVLMAHLWYLYGGGELIWS